jgi:hypothetical protein
VAAIKGPVNHRPPFHLYRKQFAVWFADHKILTGYIGFWPIYPKAATNQNGGRLRPICGLDLIGG